MDTTTLDFGSTATYATRELSWYPTGAGEGYLVIRLWGWDRRTRGRNAGRPGYEADYYKVIETDPPPFVHARAFALLNMDDATQELPYRVTIGLNAACTCKGGRCKVPECKHEGALRALLETGAFDSLDDEQPQERYEDLPGEPTMSELAGAR